MKQKKRPGNTGTFMTADDKGNLQEIEIDDIKNRAAGYLAHKMHEANLH